MKKIFISVLGWEERFLESLKIAYSKDPFQKLILIVFEDYKTTDYLSKFMSEAENNAKLFCKGKNVEFSTLSLYYNDSVDSWHKLKSEISSISKESELNLNLTTIPRETIWTLLYFIKNEGFKSIDYIYFKPNSYNKEWLTKNHKSPRLLFKHSGIYTFDEEVILFVITGFDNSRINQLIELYEPSKVVLFIQIGEQFENKARQFNFSKILKLYQDRMDIVEIDSYDIEKSIEIITDKYKKYENKNIILDSQGPKVSAIAAYKVFLNSDQKLGLSYVAARDFNNKYSSGINVNPIIGRFVF